MVRSLHLSDLRLNAELIKTMRIAQYMESGVCFASFNTLVIQKKSRSQQPSQLMVKLLNGWQMIVIANSKKYGTGVIINPRE
jgi:hypothetical protein